MRPYLTGKLPGFCTLVPEDESLVALKVYVTSATLVAGGSHHLNSMGRGKRDGNLLAE